MADFAIKTAALVGFVLALGLCLILLARWSRKRNAQLKQLYGSAPQRRALHALLNRRWREYLELNFFGDIGPVQERVAKFLSAAVIAFVIVAFATLAWLLLRLGGS